jgi:hypothetical protein
VCYAAQVGPPKPKHQTFRFNALSAVWHRLNAVKNGMGVRARVREVASESEMRARVKAKVG